MPSGKARTSPWVRVAKLKGPMMCALCGRRGVKFVNTRGKDRTVGWCSENDKLCQAVAMRCAGPVLQEHKVDATIRDMLGEDEAQR